MSNEVVNDKKLKSLKSLSKVIYVLAIIGRIVTIIGAVFATLGMAIAIICLSTINIKANDGLEISFGDNTVKIAEFNENIGDGNKITITANGEKVDIDDKDVIEVIKLADKYVNEDTKEKLIGFLVVTMIFTLVILILSAILLNKVEILFKNIAKKDTPFIKDNSGIIRKIGYYMIAITIISAMESGLSGVLLGATGISKTGVGFSLMAILIIFAAARVFDYGYDLEERNQGKIEENINE